MGTFDVTLPGSKPVTFPSICVVCEKKDPDGSMSLSILGANTSSLLETAADSVAGGPSGSAAGSNTSNTINSIPVCKSCVFGLRWYHRILKFLTYTAWLPGAILICLNVV